MDVRTKICGLTRLADVEAAASADASYVGFVFFPKSPRNLSFEAARDLAIAVPAGIVKVGLVVDPDDTMLDSLMAQVPLDMLQLHGHETPARVADIRARYGLPVMKAVGVAEESDLEQVALFSGVADQILIDAKPPRDGDLPGGNGLAFDWRLVAGRRFGKPWMLAGGLTPETVGTAISMTGVQQVDVSSGVESAPGVKDAEKIAAFVAATRAPSVPRL
ncbi:phosphoribosylanthranilate isomerase [Cognatishimia sp. F0-27]|uniref:phosphoribosylanthranilate isomerase n=1 Tax=Cognatishimia sp. F0-27 TaxID=2816855 RepID=UPI001D0C523C|nr:phosphoribosylanthranilate isomerase [Cognatishimia sp. F0-27]